VLAGEIASRGVLWRSCLRDACFHALLLLLLRRSSAAWCTHTPPKRLAGKSPVDLARCFDCQLFACESDVHDK
jgi:hypothetical protein